MAIATPQQQHLGRFITNIVPSIHGVKSYNGSCSCFSGHFLLPQCRCCSHALTVCANRCIRNNSGKALHRNKILPDRFGRRQVLLSAFIPLPVAMPESLEMEQHKSEVGEFLSFGFDGLGKNADDYALAKVLALAQAGEGAVLFLGIDGFEKPLQMVVGAAEAIAVLTAAQKRVSSRPVTHEAWSSSLAAVGWKVDRVAVTGLEREVFYSRVVLSPSGDTSTNMRSPLSDGKSVDVRPSDGIALALRCHAPLFVSKHVAKKAMEKSQKPLPEILSKPRQLDAQWILPPFGLSDIDDLKMASLPSLGPWTLLCF